jgi:hypothetical protein
MIIRNACLLWAHWKVEEATSQIGQGGFRARTDEPPGPALQPPHPLAKIPLPRACRAADCASDQVWVSFMQEWDAKTAGGANPGVA